MEKLLRRLETLLPDITFEPGETFYWSPKDSKVVYRAFDRHMAEDSTCMWSLLHEAAHAALSHKNYEHDYELLLFEVAAWEKAKELSDTYAIAISEDYIQDCLDTYRDWLHQRATCPRCSVVSLQVSATAYKCHNCSAVWTVSASRFCRPYRLSSDTTKKPPKVMPQATFQ